MNTRHTLDTGLEEALDKGDFEAVLDHAEACAVCRKELLLALEIDAALSAWALEQRAGVSPLENPTLVVPEKVGALPRAFPGSIRRRYRRQAVAVTIAALAACFTLWLVLRPTPPSERTAEVPSQRVSELARWVASEPTEEGVTWRSGDAGDGLRLLMRPTAGEAVERVPVTTRESYIVRSAEVPANGLVSLELDRPGALAANRSWHIWAMGLTTSGATFPLRHQKQGGPLMSVGADQPAVAIGPIFLGALPGGPGTEVRLQFVMGETLPDTGLMEALSGLAGRTDWKTRPLPQTGYHQSVLVLKLR